MIVVDNFIPHSLQEEIKNTLLVQNFPWYFVDDVTTFDARQNRPALSHLIYEDATKVSNLEIGYMAHFAAYQAGFKLTQIKRAKTILQFPLAQEFVGTDLDHLHIDMPDPHIVLLYYVVDADGDTIICDHRFNGTEEHGLKAENYKVIEKVTPKQGRAVIFDGGYYHTAEQPRNGIRCIINVNLA